jgi:beta-glucosidase-like glycosyl hydrolase
VPVNGRNFEYLSGEDPFLGYVLVQPTVRGIQSQVRPLLPALLFSLSQPL